MGEMDRDGSNKSRVVSTCKHCEGKYSQPLCRVKRDKFCSPECGKEYRVSLKTKNKTVCPCCDKEFIARNSQLLNGRKPYCSISCGSKLQTRSKERYEKVSNTRKENGIKPALGDLNPVWKGGRYEEKGGYVRVWVGPNQYKGEHRIVMEVHMGRKLDQDEIVHHKNHVKTDNRLENLEVMTRAQHINHHRTHKRMIEKGLIKV